MLKVSKANRIKINAQVLFIPGILDLDSRICRVTKPQSRKIGDITSSSRTYYFIAGIRIITSQCYMMTVRNYYIFVQLDAIALDFFIAPPTANGSDKSTPLFFMCLKYLGLIPSGCSLRAFKSPHVEIALSRLPLQPIASPRSHE